MTEEMMELCKRYAPSKEEIARLRKECNRPLFKRMMYETKGRKCIICGSEARVDLHHIVPIDVGGTNAPENIVPLCHVHHMLTHHSGDWKKYKIQNSPVNGRPQKVPENYEQVLDDYIHCRLSTWDVRRAFGWTKETQRVIGRPWYEKYLADHGIVSHRNNLDLLIAKHGLRVGASAGYVETVEGKELLYVSEEYYISHTTLEEREANGICESVEEVLAETTTEVVSEAKADLDWSDIMPEPQVEIKEYTEDEIPNVVCPVCGKKGCSAIGHTISNEFVPILNRHVRQIAVMCIPCNVQHGLVVV